MLNVCPIPSSKLKELIKTNNVTASNIISMAIIIRIIFFLFKINPKIPIKNKNNDRFIVYVFVIFLRVPVIIVLGEWGFILFVSAFSACFYIYNMILYKQKEIKKGKGVYIFSFFYLILKLILIKKGQ